MNIVIAGHVDHGKSTIIGRLLADTNSLPEGKLEQVKEQCQRNSKPFEYAFLLDALKDEQSQGITIDSARVFFKTKKRNYIIIDAPGHIEFLKNMVTGASRAEAALLVIDAKEGVQENSRRHGYMLSLLGIKQITVLINKMDLVDYKEEVYQNIVSEYERFLREIDLNAICYTPVSGRNGDWISNKSDNLKWFKGKTVLEILDDFKKEKPQTHKPFRMPVQDVYKFTNYEDDRRIIAGTIESGEVKVGDEIVFYPSGKRSHINSIEVFNGKPPAKVCAGDATGFTLKEQIYVKRGEMAVKVQEEHPQITTRIRVSLFWMGKKSLVKDKQYFIKLGTARIPVWLESIEKLINASNLDSLSECQTVGRHDVAQCVLRLNSAMAFDIVDDIDVTSRFVIVDDYNICGGGIILAALKDAQTWVRDNVFERNDKWIRSNISEEQRAEKYSQRSTLVLITGPKNMPRKEIARKLEEELFNEGKLVYFLGVGSLIYGVDADIKHTEGAHQEHFRRLAEVANILLDAGMILIVTAIELNQQDLGIIKAIVNAQKISTVWIGSDRHANIDYDLKIDGFPKVDTAVRNIKDMLENTTS